MKVVVSPANISGTVTAQPSKSDAHRKIICAAFARGKSLISNVVLSNDIEATLRSIENSGAEFSIINDENSKDRQIITITGTGGKKGGIRKIDCGESGSTIRFMSLVFAVGGGKTELTGEGRLPYRSMKGLIDLLKENYITCSYPGKGRYLPMTIEGELPSGSYSIDSSITSQYVSGLMMALPAFSKHGRIEAAGRYESKGYVELTKSVLKEFGILVSGNNPYIIEKNTGLRSCSTRIEGDWSNASYFLIMNAMGADIKIDGINKMSLQPDSVISEHIDKILYDESPVINISECPDIMPSLAILGAGLGKKLIITGGRRLRAKESDRLESVADGLTRLGVSVEQKHDGLEIFGEGKIKGGEINGFNDHRIVMAFSALSVVAEGDIVINGAESIEKSYPSFFEDFKKLRGIIS